MSEFRKVLLCMALSSLAVPAYGAPYVGVTAGFANDDLNGPFKAPNIPLFNPTNGQTVPTWDDWVEEATAAGIDYIAPDQRGYIPNDTAGDPHMMTELVAAIKKRGVQNRLKVAIFDDNAASWTAQWNLANGRGYGYAQPFDISDPANWVYIWDNNYKIFYQSVPDENRFKIDGRPVIIIWSMSPTFVANAKGNASKAMQYVRQQAMAEFGFNPFIIASSDFVSQDPTSATAVDALESWFIPSQTPSSYSVTTFNQNTIGVAVSSFDTQVSPDHGNTLATGLLASAQGGSELTLLEGLTDWEESCALFRVANVDASGGALSYQQSGYDYPNQRLDVVRDYSSAPFQADLLVEAEGADAFGGGIANKAQPNFYRNGDIVVEATTDTNAGYDVTNLQSAEWLEWERVPIQGSGVHLTARVASTNAGGKLHFVVDDQPLPAVAVPATGGGQTWQTLDAGTLPYSKNVYHKVRVVFDAGGFSLNFWQLATDTAFFSGFETTEPQPTWVDSADANVASNPTLVTNAQCGLSKDFAHFEQSLLVTGTIQAGGAALSESRVFDLSSAPVPLSSESSLSYFVRPKNDNGRYVAVDLHFTDGSFLRTANLTDQNGASISASQGHGGAIPLGTWSLVSADLSSLSGKMLDRIDLDFERSSGAGDYAAYVDDIRITGKAGTTTGAGGASSAAAGAPSNGGLANGGASGGGAPSEPTSGAAGTAIGSAGNGGVSATNGGASSLPSSSQSGGCGCRISTANARSFLIWGALLGLVLAASRRRARPRSN
jgi:hypothetical protein